MTKLTILTRFSRPTGFKKMVDSIGHETLKYVNFICSYEDEPLYLSVSNPRRYRNLDITWIKVDKNMTFEKDNYDYSKDGEQYSRLVANLYFNELYKEVEDSWILMMDDDDLFAPGAIKTVLSKLEDSNIDNIHIFKSEHFTGIIPRKEKLVEGNVGTANIVFHSTLINENTFWDGYRCGDFRFLNRLIENTNSTLVFHNEIIAKIIKTK